MHSSSSKAALTVIFFLAGAAGLGQQAPPPAEASNAQAEAAMAAEPSGRGSIVGIAYDASTGNPVPQATVEISGPVSFTTKTDTDGGFIQHVPPGSYAVKYVSDKYLPQSVEGVAVEAGQTADASVVLAAAGEATQVDVVASVAPEVATAASLLAERKLSSSVSDSISAEEIGGGTASDAAEALEVVTGVSVVEDQYVYVRGLGERYSATTLNNSMLATTEPERRVVPLDLFPASLIDNIKVLKTYTPDLPGEFSAGLVQIQTTEFPTKPTLSFSYSTGFNSRTQFKDRLSYPGPSTDFFGFDDGTRAFPEFLPDDTRLDRFNYSPDELQEFGRQLDAEWQPFLTDTARPTQSWNIVAGNSFGKFGIVGAIAFSNKLQSMFDQDRIFYQPNPDVAQGLADPNEAPPLPENIFVYDESTESARIGAVLNLSYRMNPATKLTLRNFYSHDTDDNTRSYTGFHQDFGTDVFDRRLRFVARTIFNTQLEGEHLFSNFGNSILTWQLGYSRALRDEPDLRESFYVRNIVRGEFEYFDDSQSAFRMFNDLSEDIYNPQIDWQVPFYKGGVNGSVKFGVNASFRRRDFQSRRLRLALRGSRGLDLTLPPNELFSDENIRPTGFELTETTRVTDAYDAERDVYGYYAMTDVAFAQRWRFVGGLRIEDVDQNVVTFDQFNPSQSRQQAPFNEVNLLPAANVIYSLSPKQNIRFGYSQTVSRPDFRELALFDFLDIVGGRQTVGNPDLLQTSIRNFDVRWEYFPGGNQLMAASFFFKSFDDPIERTIRATVGLLTTFDNADSATNYGMELEFRRSLDFLSPRLRTFAITTNLTFVDSSIDLQNVDDIVLTSRERPMQGQSRYVANAIFEWAKPTWRSVARFYTNYFSDRITDVGSFGLPDVIQQGVTTLDFVYELSLVEDGRWKLRFSAENLSDPTWRWTQGGLPFQRFTYGQTYEVGTSYRFY